MKKVKPKDKKNQHLRWIIVVAIGLLECAIIFYFFFCYVYGTEADKKLAVDLLRPVLPLIVAAPIAFLLWVFRNHDKQKDLKQKDLDIEQQNRAYFWGALVDAQNILLSKGKPPYTSSELFDLDARKAAAVYKIGEFYNPQHTDFARHIHNLFKKYLSRSTMILTKAGDYYPEHINAIYDVTSKQIKLCLSMTHEGRRPIFKIACPDNSQHGFKP